MAFTYPVKDGYDAHAQVQVAQSLVRHRPAPDPRRPRSRRLHRAERPARRQQRGGADRGGEEGADPRSVGLAPRAGGLQGRLRRSEGYGRLHRSR